MRIGLFICVALGCGGSPVEPAGDAPAPGSELTFAWRAALPGPVASTQVATAKFALRGFHAVGDAGNSASVDDAQLAWTSQGAPAPLAVAASAGVYSRLAFKVDAEGDADSYEITGTIGGAPFRIHDHSAAVSCMLDLSLAPGDTATIALDLTDAIGHIDFGRLRNDGGTLELDTDDSQISDFRSRLSTAFSALSP